MDTITVRKRLDELIALRGETYTSVSRLLGRNQTYVQQFIKHGIPRKLSESDRFVLSNHFGIDEHLLGGLDKGIGYAIYAHPGLAHKADDYVLIPQLSIAASAGDGSEPGNESPVSAMAFQSSWVRNVTKGSPEGLSVIGVEGDSMFPTLADGDQILVDTDDRTRLRDGLYVLRTDDSLLVKRLSVNPATRRLTIQSDNEAYPSWPDCDPEGVAVIGRVIWVGRRLK